MPDLPAILGGQPLLDDPCHLVRPELPGIAELVKGLDALEVSRMFTNQGVFARKLEARIAAELDVAHCALFCNGTTAIMCLARALDLQGEVLVPSFTFPATALALSWQGLVPRFVDIDRRTLMMDPRRVEEQITDRTAAIFPVNVFGACCRYDDFEELARRHGLPLICDSAEAFGAGFRGRPIGSFGAAEVLSFHATKVFHTGEGGAVVTNRSDLYEKLCRIRNFGFDSYLNCIELGLNGKLDEFSALIGLRLLEVLPHHVAARRNSSCEYERCLNGIPGLTTLEIDSDVTPSYSYFPVILDDSAFGLNSLELNYALMAEQIVTRCYFYPPVHLTTYYQRLLGGHIPGLPVTEWAARSTLCLPFHSDLAAETLHAVALGIARCQKHAAGIRDALRGKLPTDWSVDSLAAYRDPYDIFISHSPEAAVANGPLRRQA